MEATFIWNKSSCCCFDIPVFDSVCTNTDNAKLNEVKISHSINLSPILWGWHLDCLFCCPGTYPTLMSLLKLTFLYANSKLTLSNDLVPGNSIILEMKVLSLISVTSIAAVFFKLHLSCSEKGILTDVGTHFLKFSKTLSTD